MAVAQGVFNVTYNLDRETFLFFRLYTQRVLDDSEIRTRDICVRTDRLTAGALWPVEIKSILIHCDGQVLNRCQLIHQNNLNKMTLHLEPSYNDDII